MSENYISYETLVATRESAQWAYWSMVGTWLSGIATFLAVVTSLYIALRKPRAFVTGGVRLVRMLAGNDEYTCVTVTVVNQSLHSIKVNSICWVLSKENEAQQLFRNPESDNLPTRLEHGEEANYRIIFDDSEDDWIHRFARTLKKHEVDINNLKCLVVLSTGERYRIKLYKPVKDKIAEAMKII